MWTYVVSVRNSSKLEQKRFEILWWGKAQRRIPPWKWRAAQCLAQWHISREEVCCLLTAQAVGPPVEGLSLQKPAALNGKTCRSDVLQEFRIVRSQILFSHGSKNASSHNTQRHGMWEVQPQGIDSFFFLNDPLGGANVENMRSGACVLLEMPGFSSSGRGFSSKPLVVAQSADI